MCMYKRKNNKKVSSDRRKPAVNGYRQKIKTVVFPVALHTISKFSA